VTEIFFDILYMSIMGLTRCYNTTVFYGRPMEQGRLFYFHHVVSSSFFFFLFFLA